MRLDSKGIHYKYRPIIWNEKTIPWKEVKNIQVKSVSPLSDFGGWGYKLGFKQKGTGIILSGDHALFITRKIGKNFTITTNRKLELSRVAEFWMNESDNG